MSYTIPTMKHDPTGVTIETFSDTLPNQGTKDTKTKSIRVLTGYVNTTVTHFDSLDGWTSQSIHLHTGKAKPLAEIGDVGVGGPYVVVTLDDNINVFVPMSIAEAIYDAVGFHEAVAG